MTAGAPAPLSAAARVAPPPAEGPGRDRLVLLALLTGIGLWFVFSPALINRFYPYVDPGGNPIGKIHPGTYVLALGLLFSMVVIGPVQFVNRAFKGRVWLLQYAAMLVWTALFLFSRFGIGGLAYLIDTFLAAICALLMAVVLPERERLHLLRVLLAALLINAFVAIIERVLGTHLVPHMIYNDFGFFRSSAFLGHPLTNGLITGTAGLIVLFLPMSFVARASLAFVMLAALLCFSSRASLLTFCLGAAVGFGHQALSAAIKGRGRAVYVYWAPVAAVVLSLGLTVLFSLTDFTNRIAIIFTGDESVNERFDTLRIFRLVSWEDLMRGIDLATIQLLIEKDPDLKIIENFWIFLILNFGLVTFTLFTISFLIFLLGLCREAGGGAYLCVAIFVLAASSNNSLATKTSALTLCTLAFFSMSALRSPGAARAFSLTPPRRPRAGILSWRDGPRT